MLLSKIELTTHQNILRLNFKPAKKSPQPGLKFTKTEKILEYPLENRQIFAYLLTMLPSLKILPKE